ncbi:MAG TPA: hypothetical protein VGG07_25170 [Solirubrobacteraceae bacterium]|jgi:hypothetical protein
MSNLDTPDYVRGSVSADRLLASLSNPAFTVTVPLAPNVEVIWIFGQGDVDPLPTIVGADSGFSYPAFWAPWQGPNVVNWFSVVAIVTGALDESLIITWTNAPSNRWYVVADTGGRFVIDAALSATIQIPSLPAPDSAVQIAGTDGTDLRVLLTDTDGKLQVAGSTFPAVYGTPGDVAPADALQVGGSDGTDLHVINVDSDGTQYTEDVVVGLATGLPAAAAPFRAMQVGATDGTDLRALRGDQQGVLYAIGAIPNTAAGDHPPVELSTVGGGYTLTSTVLAAPGAGMRYRLFFAQLAPITAGLVVFLQDSVSSALYGFSGLGAVESVPYPGQGIPMATDAALNLVFGTGAGTAYAFVAYTLETV